VGGTDPADRNLISGNDFAGVTIVNASTTSNWVEGNFIGTDDTGDLPLPNAGPGVRIFNVAGITVGGGAPGAGNRIAFNGGAGIRVDATAGSANALLGNSIEANAGLGLDLGGDGVTSNDPPASLDGDGGPNGLQNFPVLAAASVEDGTTTVEGTLDSAASTIYRVEFFASPDCDSSGYGEGADFLGWMSVATEASGQGDFVFDAPFDVPLGQALTATTTDPAGSTSELSACVVVPEPPASIAGIVALAALVAIRLARRDGRRGPGSRATRSAGSRGDDPGTCGGPESEVRAFPDPSARVLVREAFDRLAGARLTRLHLSSRRIHLSTRLTKSQELIARVNHATGLSRPDVPDR
jgi:hypothetical protein